MASVVSGGWSGAREVASSVRTTPPAIQRLATASATTPADSAAAPITAPGSSDHHASTAAHTDIAASRTTVPYATRR